MTMATTAEEGEGANPQAPHTHTPGPATPLTLQNLVPHRPPLHARKNVLSRMRQCVGLYSLHESSSSSRFKKRERALDTAKTLRSPTHSASRVFNLFALLHQCVEC